MSSSIKTISVAGYKLRTKPTRHFVCERTEENFSKGITLCGVKFCTVCFRCTTFVSSGMINELLSIGGTVSSSIYR